MVQYKAIAGFPGYRVGDDGSAWSCRRIGQIGGVGNVWRRLKPLIDRSGYHMIAPRKNGRNHTRKLHRLILEAFVGPCPKGMECRHFPNRDNSDNRLRNLSWGTPIENADDKKKTGTYQCGEQCHTAKLTIRQVKWIRKLYATGKYTQDELAAMFGVKQTPISLIIRRKTWKHI